MSPYDLLLSRLDGVRVTGPGRAIALCPAHDDRRPSLTIREREDGALLIRCHANCGAVAVLDALGLTLADLFPEPAKVPGIHYHRPSRQPIPAADALRIVSFEAGVTAIIALDLSRGKPLTPDTRDRLLLAHARIATAAAPYYD